MTSWAHGFSHQFSRPENSGPAPVLEAATQLCQEPEGGAELQGPTPALRELIVSFWRLENTWETFKKQR